MKLFILIILSISISGCLSEKEQKRIEGQKKRVHLLNEMSVPYFKTCIEGNLFIASPGNHGISLAGPVGKCKTP